jgi:hypothetical protein
VLIPANAEVPQPVEEVVVTPRVVAPEVPEVAPRVPRVEIPRVVTRDVLPVRDELLAIEKNAMGPPNYDFDYTVPRGGVRKGMSG